MEILKTKNEFIQMFVKNKIKFMNLEKVDYIS